MGVKLSVSLADEDVATLDAYVRAADLPSRSAAVQHAVRLLRHANLEQDYAHAFEEWTMEDDGAWTVAGSDGV